MIFHWHDPLQLILLLNLHIFRHRSSAYSFRVIKENLISRHIFFWLLTWLSSVLGFLVFQITSYLWMICLGGTILLYLPLTLYLLCLWGLFSSFSCVFSIFHNAILPHFHIIPKLFIEGTNHIHISLHPKYILNINIKKV